MSQVYRTLKVEIPWRLVEERPVVLDLVTRMYLAAAEYVRRLLKEVTGQEEPRLTPNELNRLLTPDRRKLAHKIIEEVFPSTGSQIRLWCLSNSSGRMPSFSERFC